MRADRYLILGTLGQDPAGTTYLALDSDLDQRVVYKQFSPEVAADKAFITGLREEARLMARFDHTNLVHVVEFFDGPETVVVTEYVRGASLRAAVNVHGRLTPVQALATMKGLLSGLAFAHDLGLVHRDIRPENVLADSDGVARLTAFGQTPRTLSRDRVREIPGRIAAYMSPERMKGGAVGPSADIYSCGALMFMLLTGEAPYTGTDLKGILHEQATKPAPSPRQVVSDLPDRLSSLVTRAMSPAPAARPESADHFGHELEAIALAEFGPDWMRNSSIKGLVEAAAAEMSGDLSLAEDVQAEETVEHRIDRVGWFVGAAAAMAVVAAGGVGFAYARGLFSLRAGTAVVATPTAAALPSPSAASTPSPTPAPTPTPAVAVPPPATPPPTAPNFVSLSSPAVWFQACMDSAAANCGIALSGTNYSATSPFDASGYPVIRLMDTFNWNYRVTGSQLQQVTTNWTVSNRSGAGGSYPQIIMNRTLASSSSTQGPDGTSEEIVTSADPPSKSSASFTIVYTDGDGPHSLTSPTFYWTH